MTDPKTCARGRCNQGLANWVAHYYLFGVIPLGNLVIGCGVSGGEAWLIARTGLRLWARWLVGIVIKG